MRLASAFVIIGLLTLAGRAEAASADRDLSLLAAAYAAPTFDSETGPLAYLPGEGLIRRRSSGAQAAGEIHSVRLATAEMSSNAALSLLRPGVDVAGRQAIELTYIRHWPDAVSLQAGRLSLDVTPHAGLGLSSAGRQLAEAGAMLSLSALQRRVWDAVGVRRALEGSKVFLYAGASGRAVGLNLLSTQAMTAKADPYGDGFVREAQAGLGFSRGAVSASFGYTYEQVRYRTLGDDRRANSRVGLTLAVRPRL